MSIRNRITPSVLSNITDNRTRIFGFFNGTFLTQTSESRRREPRWPRLVYVYRYVHTEKQIILDTVAKRAKARVCALWVGRSSPGLEITKSYWIEHLFRRKREWRRGASSLDHKWSPLDILGPVYRYTKFKVENSIDLLDFIYKTFNKNCIIYYIWIYYIWIEWK